ncbi:MAG: right-handed parallel beta-helix repeat-containing protein [Phycisphaeraceae bacterium]|nr:right-handed parallel beta-helix repeat-containing protein [Phycisphaeraceae bacterium]
MKFQTACVVVCAAAGMINSIATAKPISDVLGAQGGQFDPWNQQRWADWYENGEVVEPFEIDCPVTFAQRDTPWQFSTERYEQVQGKTEAVFRVTAADPIMIDGNGLVIDVQKPAYRDWTLQDWYSHSIKPDEMFHHIDGFHFRQVKAGDEPSVLRNITLMGFWRGAETDEDHQNRPVIWDKLTTKRNICGLYTTLRNGVIRQCDISENIHIGIYVNADSTGWVIENSTFRDNNIRGARSWTAVTLDACYQCIIRNNRFLGPSFPPRDYNSAISLYRNQGERDDIREYPASWNLIEDNFFQGYNLAIDSGVRTGKKSTSVLVDLAHEGRCYVAYNTIRRNTFEDCKIGVLLRTNYNTIDSNVFANVQRPVALNNVFFSLHHNVIVNQPDDTVWLWSEPSEYGQFAPHMAYHDELSATIGADRKLYHVISPQGAPRYSDPGRAMLVVSPDLVAALSDVDDPDYNTFKISPVQAQMLGFGNKPIAVTVGQFAADHPASDFAVIFDQPCSQVESEVYYSIILYDQNGCEFDRCGRSKTRWGVIAAGNFLPDSGTNPRHGNAEIAAASSQPDSDGCYPIYIFPRGFADPKVVLMKDNTRPVKAMVRGRFKTDGDEYDELAVLLEDDTVVRLLKPTDPTWSEQIESDATKLLAMTSGEFDGNSDNGDEIAALTQQAGPALLLKSGHRGAFATVGPTGSWHQIASGRFGRSTASRDDLAMIARQPQGVTIQMFGVDQPAAYVTLPSDVAGEMPIALTAGAYRWSKASASHIGCALMPDSPPEALRDGCDALALLPQTSSTSIPVLVWLTEKSNLTNSIQKQVVPLLK